MLRKLADRVSARLKGGLSSDRFIIIREESDLPITDIRTRGVILVNGEGKTIDTLDEASKIAKEKSNERYQYRPYKLNSD